MNGERRRIRIGLLGFYHEANSFAPVQVDDAYVRAAGTFWGEDVLREFRGSASTAGGFIAAAEADGQVDLVPMVLSVLVPAGPVTAEALATQVGYFRESLAANGPFDGVLVVLHGAAVAEDVDDVDGHLLGVVRDAVGPGVVIGTSLDLHANISARMCEAADLLNTYRTNPHVDARPMAEEIGHLVFDAARGVIVPTLAFVPIPAFINILRQNTDVSPMSDVIADVVATAALTGVLTATVAEGYPYADVPEMGMSAVVITDDAPVQAAELARALAERVWERRDEFDARIPKPEEALEIASSTDATPVLLLDVGDNVGGGSPGDSVVLLDAAIRTDFRDLVSIVHDPAAAASAHRTGVGGVLDVVIGPSAAAVRGKATVIGLSDGTFEATGTLHAGFRRFDAGPSAALRLGTGQTVVVTTRVTLPLTPVQLEEIGLSLTDYRAIVAKGVHSPLAGYGPRVGLVLQVDTPGVTGADCSLLPYRRRRRPLFPLERDAHL
ncbi:M81 family metallopeptidase [Microbacterium sp. BWT-B31]|uniref:M81 family metallopeptidase n=1 Tax=Microbacterium sp. BWT-B31 TaxID=3232072 RepID=UPI0035279803